MSLVVHGRASSSNTQCVMWVASELGLEVDRRDVGGPYGGNDDPAFRAISPFGLVPAIEDGDQAFFEAPVICRYLVDTYDEAGVFNTSPWCAAWAEWCKWRLSRAYIEPIFWRYFRTPEAERDMPQVMLDLREFERLAGIALEARNGAAWLGGDRLSLGDIWFGHLLFRYFTMGLPLESPDGLAAYYEACKARPAYAAHVMIDYADVQGVPF